MADVKKAPYFQIQKSLFGSALKEFKGAQGCIPLDMQKGVSLDRPAPGEKNPPSPKPPTEPRKTQKKIKIPQPKQPSKFEASENERTTAAT
ncbi:hypothetical protein [uncultured Herbaspirillum sp.]|jgi:hypothetical protein|uniref:hypothetical protein n=1 Tax=uncultured Herbaspirillum sp. TaxID=160236 RepID=UPI0025898C7C|nr:hypothetical protein [uncultured Herbaspirillum sp.]